VAYFHLKDTKDGEWLEVGQGPVDFEGLFQLVQGRDLAWAVVEQDETRRTPLESARLSREHLKREVGL
jgi:sugar phosphate isomerase/epimerase